MPEEKKKPLGERAIPYGSTGPKPSQSEQEAKPEEEEEPKPAKDSGESEKDG